MHRAKELTKKVYNNEMNSVKIWHEMDTIFMNSENREIFYPHRALIDLSDKINLERKDKYVALSYLSIY